MELCPSIHHALLGYLTATYTVALDGILQVLLTRHNQLADVHCDCDMCHWHSDNSMGT